MRVTITGAEGTVGSILAEQLPHEISSFDLPEHDARDIDAMRRELTGQDALVHCSWNIANEHCGPDGTSPTIDPDNSRMFSNAYRAASLAGVSRVVMISSVHADNFTEPRDALLMPTDMTSPHCPYGSSKIYMEMLGKYYSRQDIGVVCLRLGAVRSDNEVTNLEASERHLWLSHQDLVNLAHAALSAPEIPDNYAVVYGVSHNDGRIHDTANQIGWQPL